MSSGNIATTAWRAVVAGLLPSLAFLSFAASAADKSLVNKGEVLVRDNCSRCHAIGKEGASPHPQSTPIPDLVQQIPHTGSRRVACRRDCLGPPRHARLCVRRTRRRGHHPISAKHTDQNTAQKALALSRNGLNSCTSQTTQTQSKAYGK